MVSKMIIHDNNILQPYLECGIICLGDLVSATEADIMNKILKSIHPYKIYFSERDGRWHTQVQDITQPRGYRQIARKKECDIQKYLLQFYNVKKSYTLENLYQEFMEYKKATQKQGTINMYVKAYQKYYENDSIATMDLSKIDAVTLKIWLCNNINMHKLNYKSYNQMTVVLNQLYKYAMEKGYLDRNPFDAINTKSLGLYNMRKKKSQQKAYTKNEASDISKIAFEDFQQNPHSTALAVLLAFQTGMRVGEIVVLKWSDLDLNSKTITVSRMETYYQEISEDNKSLGKCIYEVIEGNTKGIFGERIVDLTEDAIYILELLKDYYQSQHINTEWLFVNKSGKRIHNRAMQSHLKKYCKLANMPMFKSMHKIRSTYISLLRDAGMSFEKIAEEVGHKSVTTTMQNYSFDVNSDEENRRILNSGLNVFTKSM